MGRSEGVFDELFMSKEEENIYYLAKLEKEFIQDSRQILISLAHEVITAKENYYRALTAYNHYKNLLANKKEVEDGKE